MDFDLASYNTIQKGNFVSLHENHNLKTYFRKIFDSNIPFLSMINSDGTFQGNVWFSDIEELRYLHNFAMNVKLKTILEEHPEIVEKDHYVDEELTRKRNTLHKTTHQVFPVLDSKFRVIGHFDSLKHAYVNNFLTNLFAEGGTLFNCLIIDEDIMSMENISNHFLDKGYICKKSSDPKLALDFLKNDLGVSVVIVNIEMKDWDGITLISQIREISEDLSIIAIGKDLKKDLTDECIKYNVGSFHKSPINIDLLANTVNTFKKFNKLSVEKNHEVKINSLLRLIDDKIDFQQHVFNDSMTLLSNELSQLLNCKYISIIFYDEDSHSFTIRASTNKNIVNQQIVFDEAPLLKEVFDTKQSFISNSKEDFEIFGDVNSRFDYKTHSTLIVPILVGNDICGFITSADKERNDSFEQDDIDLIKSIIPALRLIFSYSVLDNKYNDLKKTFSELQIEKSGQSLEQNEFLSLKHAAMLAHDIRNPLAVCIYHITTFINKNEDFLIDKGEDLDFEILKKMTKVQVCLEKIDQLTKTVLGFSQDDTSENLLKSFNLSEAIHCSVLMLEKKINQNEIKIEIDINIDDSIRVMGVQLQIERVIMNLVSNAVDAAKSVANPNISIRSSYDKFSKQYVVKISDNGPGIKTDNFEKLFNEFYAAKGAGEGIGLGLYISKTLVHRHGGELIYRRENNLTVFYLKLPRLK